jgi:hypothetical protein
VLKRKICCEVELQHCKYNIKISIESFIEKVQGSEIIDLGGAQIFSGEMCSGFHVPGNLFPICFSKQICDLKIHEPDSK